MVRQAQKVDQLRQPKGVLGEGSLCVKEEKNGWGWFSKITAVFKGLGRTKVDDQVREEIVRDGREVSPKEGNTGVKPTRVRSNNTGKTSRKSTGAAVRAAAAKGKSKSKAVSKG